MNIRNFITKTEYPEFKKIMLNEFITRPLDIKATTTASIALEVKASQVAIEKLKRAFDKFESLAEPEIIEKKPYR